MGKISDFLAGIKVLEIADSKYNDKITVVKSLAFGTYFQVGGLTQSGGIIKGIWNHSLRRVYKMSKTPETSKILVLGLGGGSIIEVIRSYWPDSKITAVDIDPVIVSMGIKYLGLTNETIKINIKDAYEFSNREVRRKVRYDLVCVDLYVGDNYPPKFEEIFFVKLISDLLQPNGIAVINRLYYGEKRTQSVKFGNSLEKMFKKVDWVYPEANIMFICHK